MRSLAARAAAMNHLLTPHVPPGTPALRPVPHSPRNPMSLSRTASLALLALVAATGPAAAQRATVIRDVRVFDGTRVIPSATVVVRDGVIASVGAAGAIP